MIHIYNSRVPSCAEALNISCWFFDKHKNVVMLPNIFVLIKSLLYSLLPGAAYSDHGGSGKQPADHLGNVSMVPHSSVRLCCRRKGYSHQRLVVSCTECGGWWSGGVTINTRALIMFSVTTATRITHDSNLSMFGGDFLPTLGESPPHRAAAHKHHLFIST